MSPGWQGWGRQGSSEPSGDGEFPCPPRLSSIPLPSPARVSGFLDHGRAQLAVQTKRVASQVDGGAQVQQVLNIECLRDFLTPPLLSVRFR